MVVLVDSNSPEEVACGDNPWLAMPRRVVHFLLGKGPRHLWVLSLLLLSAIAAWAYLDPFFEWAILGSDFAALLIEADNTNSMSTTDWEGAVAEVGWRGTAFSYLIFSNLILILLLIYGLISGPKLYRSLRALLMLTTLACLWVGLTMSIPNITWYGKHARVSRLLSSFEPIVAELKESWPRQDGHSAALGPFKAYPLTDPTTLILLTSPPLSESGMRLKSVVRSKTGALRFFLAGSELGDWLEWHPPGEEPSSFNGGLQENYNLMRRKELRDGWYLVRYGR